MFVNCGFNASGVELVVLTTIRIRKRARKEAVRLSMVRY
jgi:hypothetical protein